MKRRIYRHCLEGAMFLLFATSASAYDIYVSNEKDNTNSIIDGISLKVTDTVTVSETPTGIVLSLDNSVLYICTSGEDHVEVLDLEASIITHTLPTGPDPALMGLNSEGTMLHIANENDNLVTVVNIQERNKDVEIPVGIRSEWIGASLNSKWLVNTYETISMGRFINAETLKIKSNVLVDTSPPVGQFTGDGSKVWVSFAIDGAVSTIAAERKVIKYEKGFEVPGWALESTQLGAWFAISGLSNEIAMEGNSFDQ